MYIACRLFARFFTMHYYSYFTDKEIEAWEGKLSCLTTK